MAKAKTSKKKAKPAAGKVKKTVRAKAKAAPTLESQVAALDHPNIATIYALEQANDLFFITLLQSGRVQGAGAPSDPYDEPFRLFCPFLSTCA